MSRIEYDYVEYGAKADEFYRVADAVEERYRQLGDSLSSGAEATFQAKQMANSDSMFAGVSSGMANAVVLGGAVAAPAFGALMAAELRAIGRTLDADGQQSDDFSKIANTMQKQELLVAQLESGMKIRMEEWKKHADKHAAAASSIVANSTRVNRAADATGYFLIRMAKRFGDGPPLMTQLGNAYRWTADVFRASGMIIGHYTGLSYRAIRRWGTLRSLIIIPGRAILLAGGMFVVASSMIVRGITAAYRGTLAGLSYMRAKWISFVREVRIIVNRIRVVTSFLFTPVRWVWKLVTWPIDGYIKKIKDARREMGLLGAAGVALTAPIKGGFKGVKKVAGMEVGPRTAYAGMVGSAIAVSLALKKALVVSSDLNESQEKMGVIFQSSKDQAKAFVEEMVSSYKVNRREASDAMSAFGQSFEQTGASSAQIQKTSAEFTKLAYDMASFHNVDLPEVIGAIGASLRGEADSIDRFGIDTREAAVQAEGLRMGLVKLGQEMTESQKIRARTEIIRRGAAPAKDDMDKNYGTAANSMKRAQAMGENLTARIGGDLSTVFTAGKGVGKVMEWLNEQYDKNRDTFMVWLQYFKSGMDVARRLIMNLPTVWKIVQIGFMTRINNIASIIWYMVDVVMTAGQAIWNDLPGLFKEALSNIWVLIKNWISNVWATMTNGWNGISSTVSIIFNKLLSTLDGITGGLLSNIFDVKSEDELKKEWERMKKEMGFKDLTEGMSFEHFDKLKKQIRDVQGPIIKDPYEEMAPLVDSLTGKIADGIESGASEAEKAISKVAPKGSGLGPDKEATPEEEMKKLKVDFVNIDEANKKIQEAISNKEDKEEKKKQTKLQEQTAENTRETAIMLRRQEQARSQNVAAK